MRYALCAKRGNVNIKHNKVLVLIVWLGDTQTHWASLVRVARSVPLVSMHQSKLLCAETARWDDTRNKTQLLLLPAEHVVRANMLRTNLEAQQQKAVKLVLMGSTKTRILHPPTVAQAVGQACILLPPRVRLVRLALQGSTMVQV